MHWMQNEKISFAKLKLSNNKQMSDDQSQNQVGHWQKLSASNKRSRTDHLDDVGLELNAQVHATIECD
jgi:hypothetical protein